MIVDKTNKAIVDIDFARAVHRRRGR